MNNEYDTPSILLDEAFDSNSLERDVNFQEPLKRIAYEAGMLLGLEATRDEQDYHRRRLNRHQYWLHGYGTVVGLAIKLIRDPEGSPTHDETLRVEVTPGIGIDGLGRELMVHEPYCVNLSQWLAGQTPESLVEGFKDETLSLIVTVRHKDCASGFQPVLARKLNASTDAVNASRIADSVLLEMAPHGDTEAEGEEGEEGKKQKFWPAHSLSALDQAELSDSEKTLISTEADTDQKAKLEAMATRIYGLPDGTSALAPQETAERLARIPLALLQIATNTVTDIKLTKDNVQINNLMRPFVAGADHLSTLHTLVED